MDIENLEVENIALGFAVFLIAAVFAFSAVQEKYTYSETVQTDFEVNSSQDVTEVGFFNHSVDLMLEDSTNATFYLDIDRDGSADRVIGQQSSSKIRRTTELVDFPDSVYRLYIQYQDDPEKEGDAWMNVYQVKRLG